MKSNNLVLQAECWFVEKNTVVQTPGESTVKNQISIGNDMLRTI